MTTGLQPEIKNRIEKILDENKIVLFMKGTANFPMCGFSARAVGILQDMGIDFLVIDVVEDSEMRDAIKIYGNWPTLPQLYINKQLIGGSDIMMEMYQNGELQDLIKASSL